MQISKEIETLLKEHPELFDEESGFNKLYAYIRKFPSDVRSEVTMLLYEAGVDPLQNVNFIAPYMFNNIKLGNVIVPSQIEKVFAHGFCNFTAKTIMFDNPDTYISTEAFMECNVDTIVLPDRLNEINPNLFYKAQIKQVVFPKCDIIIKPDAFSNAYVNEMIFQNVEEIPYDCFMGRSDLRELTLPANLKYIESFAFDHCGLFYLHYKGTMEQWHQIRKDSNWNKGSSITYINCLDGRLHL